MMSRTLGECETVKQTLLLDNEIKSNLLYYTLVHWRCSGYVLRNVSLWRACSKITPHYLCQSE